MLCDKLEFLEVHSITISPLKLLAVQIEVSKNEINNYYRFMAALLQFMQHNR